MWDADAISCECHHERPPEPSSVHRTEDEDRQLQNAEPPRDTGHGCFKTMALLFLHFLEMGRLSPA